VLSLSLTQEFVRPLYHWRTSRPHEYTDSMLNSRGDDDALFTDGPAHGAPPHNVRLGADDFLLDHLGGGFDLLYFTEAAGIPAPLRQVADAVRARGVPLRVVAIGAAQPVAGADLSLADADGHVRRRYGVQASGTAYLLRPDQHVCARWLTLDATRLQAAFDAALPR
jgi:3-(3-hydroxy-phenyl)propionate hydroxylase